MVCFTKLTPRTPPSVIHGWKATDLLYEMKERKNYLLNPVSRQNFADALAENHNLKLEVCHIKFPAYKDHRDFLRVWRFNNMFVHLFEFDPDVDFENFWKILSGQLWEFGRILSVLETIDGWNTRIIWITLHQRCSCCDRVFTFVFFWAKHEHSGHDALRRGDQKRLLPGRFGVGYPHMASI